MLRISQNYTLIRHSWYIRLFGERFVDLLAFRHNLVVDTYWQRNINAINKLEVSIMLFSQIDYIYYNILRQRALRRAVSTLKLYIIKLVIVSGIGQIVAGDF